MPFDVALADLVSPYVLYGQNVGAAHAALAVLSVGDYESAADETGIVIRGTAHLHGNVKVQFHPDKMTFTLDGDNSEGHPIDDPSRRNPLFDIRDTSFAFELAAPRRASLKIDKAETQLVGSNTAGAFAGAPKVLDAWDSLRTAQAPSDYPGTAFTLDLLVTSAVLRPPFLKGADLRADGLLVPRPAGQDSVTFTMPALKIRFSQGTAVNDPIKVDLLSLGASGLDDTDGLEVIDLITMDPPYAFFGPSHVAGLGFRSAILDLGGGTPPEVLEQFGYDESWTGVYLPEIRLFVAPHGVEDLAVDAGAHNLLIGFGRSAGITGDFDIELIQQGSFNLDLGARFFDADRQGYSITRSSPTSATASLPDKTRMVIDIQGGRAPYNASLSIDGAPAQPGRLFDIDLTSQASRSLHIQVVDSHAPANSADLTVTANRRPAVAPAVGPGGAGTPGPPVPVATLTSASTPPIVMVSQTETNVTVSLQPPDANTQWTLTPGGVQPGGSTCTIELPVGPTPLSVSIDATVPGGTVDATAFMDWDRPTQEELEANYGAYVGDPIRTSTQPAPTQAPNALADSGGLPVDQLWHDALETLPVGTTIQIKGFASYDADPSKGAYNLLLSARRAEALRQLIEATHPGHFVFDASNPDGYATSKAEADADNPAWPGDRNRFWKAVIMNPPLGHPALHGAGQVDRPAQGMPPPAPPPVIVVNDPPPASPPPPSWFRSAALKVRIVRDHFVAIELDVDVDFDTATEQAMRHYADQGHTPPTWQGLGSQNPADGIVHFKAIFQVDDATGDWSMALSAGADPDDRNGLLFTGLRPGQDPSQVGHESGRDILGIFALMTPLLAQTAPINPASGDVGALVMTGAAIALPVALAGLDMLHVERVVLYGAELVVKKTSDGVVVTLLADVETALSATIPPSGPPLVSIRAQHPLVVRYKAIGIKLGRGPGEPPNQLRPMFDASKGYSIDLSGPGAVTVPDPLGQVIKVLGARIARTNPLNFEVDLGFALDLGVVSVDRLKLRLQLDPGPPIPKLTAIGAGVDIPGAIKGHGYFEFADDGGFTGQIDLTLVPVNMRIAAGLGVHPISPVDGGPATAVIITLEVDLPVAIPLGASGLGIYGFLGLFGMHFRRNEDPVAADPNPALAWLAAVGGEVTDLSQTVGGQPSWKPAIGHWAFGVGAVLGTMEGGVIFNLKGMFVLELPGPRMLLLMKAKLIQVKPELHSNAEGLLLAVIDLDCGRGTLTIGIIASYEIKSLLSIRIPVEAFFNFHAGSDWHLYLGKFDGPIHASILEVFDGIAYLMISGNGIDAHQTPPSPTPMPKVDGFAIALGLHVSITWGDTDAGLYVKVAAGIDAVIGFSPFRMAGTLFLQGELRLFIVSLSAHADLHVDVGTDDQGQDISLIDGDVCGEVDLFFFSLSGCVHFHLGQRAVALPAGADLVQGLSLMSRSPALVAGTGVDKPIDVAIANAVVASDSGSALADRALPMVPVDVIPLLMMSAPPLVTTWAPPTGGGITFSPGGTPGVPGDGWVARGDDVYQYTLSAVDLIAHAPTGAAVVTPTVSAGATPATWITPTAPTDAHVVAELALLSWVPDATPKALGSSQFLNEKITDRWATLCSKAAPPAAVLWTFRHEVLGASAAGWTLLGAAWPDPPGTLRSGEANVALHVEDRWRSGVAIADALRGIAPAEVVAATVACPSRPAPPTPGLGVGTGTSVVTDTHLDPAGRAVPQVTSSALGSVVAANAALRGAKLVEVTDTAPPLSLAEVIDRAVKGQPLSRAQLLTAGAVAGAGVAGSGVGASSGSAGPIVPTPPAGGGGPLCSARVLEAPMFDDQRTIAWGDPANAPRVEHAWSTAHFQPSPLGDAITIRTGGFTQTRLLLWLQRPLVAQNLCARALDANGNELQRVFVTTAQLVNLAALPAPWVDPAGPWRDDVLLAASHLSTLFPALWAAALVEINADPNQVDRVELGLADPARFAAQQREVVGRPYYLAAIESIRLDETVRADHDSQTVQADHGVLQAALAVESSDNAILLADTLYEVRTNWSTQAGTCQPGSSTVDNKQDQHPQVPRSFWFRTDAVAPKSLEPWLLCTTPGADEPHYFWNEPLAVVFGTNDVGRVWDTYGKRLQVRLSAASFAQVDPSIGVAHPMPLDAAHLQAVKVGDTAVAGAGGVLSPWEDAVVGLISDGVIDPQCLAVDGERVRQSKVTIPIPLAPLTDYLIDVEQVDKFALDPTGGPSVLRRSFSTSRYPDSATFAATFVGTLVEHRGLKVGAVAEILAALPSLPPKGPQLDTAFSAAGLEAFPVPKRPRIVVFWEATVPTVTPTAVLIDGDEPLFRDRPYPAKVTDPVPEGAFHWELIPRPWLALEPVTHAADPQADDVAAQVVVAPGGQRALVVLAAGARGRRLKLALRQRAFSEPYLDGPGAVDGVHLLADLALLAAPWEE